MLNQVKMLASSFDSSQCYVIYEVTIHEAVSHSKANAEAKTLVLSVILLHLIVRMAKNFIESESFTLLA